MTKTIYNRMNNIVFALLISCFVGNNLLFVNTFALKSTSEPPLLNSPTYALATLNKDGTTNMNIVTYATPISIRPNRVWSMGIYKETLSQDNILRNPVCILQLLSEKQVELVKVLGGFSGKEIDKKEECAKLGFEWNDLEGDEFGFQVLPGCTHYMKLLIQGGLVDAGSHLSVPFCQVEEMYVVENDDESSRVHLSTSKLRELGIINAAGRVVKNEESKS